MSVPAAGLCESPRVELCECPSGGVMCECPRGRAVGECQMGRGCVRLCVLCRARWTRRMTLRKMTSLLRGPWVHWWLAAEGTGELGDVALTQSVCDL